MRLTPQDADRIIRLVASHLRIEVNAQTPFISAELPETGERFSGVLPPVTRAPAFAIRKRAISVISLAQYVLDGFMTESQALALRAAVRERRNIVIAGGTGTGKTTRRKRRDESHSMPHPCRHTRITASFPLQP